MEPNEHRNKTVIDEKHKMQSSNIQTIAEIEKEGFDGDNNFIDYFMIIGVKPEIFKNSYLYNSNSISEINNNLIPQIITKFPKIDKKHIVIENSIPQQIFPMGFNVIESETKPVNQFYSVILDNQLYSATYTNKYIACLLIYENIQDYEILNEKYKISDSLSKMMRSNSIKSEQNTKNEKYKKYYIPKCLCLVSVYPAINRFEEILNSLYNLVNSNQFNNLYIDRIIEKLVMEIPKLPRGLKKIFLSLPPNNLVDLTENKMNDLPLININLPKFFSILDFSIILEVFRFLLFETKLIFFGKNLFDLTNSIMSIISLIYPFKYQFQIVSILPKELYHFIETISPYIFGINETYDEKFFKRNNIHLDDATICIIDLDNNKNYIRIKNAKNLNKDYPPFPKNLKEKIEKDYSKYKKEKENRKSKEIKDIYKSIKTKMEDENKEYQLIFFNFMIALLKDYQKYLSKDYGVNKDISMSIKDMIDTNAYANSFNINDRDFYNHIFNTQMFIEFIYKRMMPKNYNEKVEILFFEEKINQTKLKKSIFKSRDNSSSLLLNSEDYDYDNETIHIDCSTDIGVTQKLYDYIIANKEEAINNFINNGYDIDIDEENKLINFKYHIFPCLLSDKFFAFNYEQYKKPKIYYTTIDEINLKIVNKSHLQFNTKSKETLTEEGNDVYLCYLIMWSLVLWYTDEYERELRFLQMIEIIEKVQGHEIQIFELLFKALVDIKWTDKDIVLLYKKFIHLNLNPTWKIFSMVNKIIKKKANVKKKKELLSQETQFKDLKLKNKFLKRKKTYEERNNFRSRTLKNKLVDDTILSEDVIFYAYGKCSICDDYINLINLCSNLYQLKTIRKENTTDDFFKCPNKHKKEEDTFSKFELKLKHGIELFNTNMKSNSNSTSIEITIPLMSPSTMKNDLLKISTKLEKENKKFDVENFKLKNKTLFWNLVWYFQLNDIDISFMLPYANELHPENDLNLENLKKFIDIRYRADKEINIENIVKNKDLDLDFLICSNRDSLQGKNINAEEIKNDLFNKDKLRYEKYDLIMQKIFRFHISDKTGMISYLSLNNYSENLAYNEYPTQFKEIPDITINYINSSNKTQKNIIYKDSNDVRMSMKKKSPLVLENKSSNYSPNKTSNYVNKNLSKLNTFNFGNKTDMNLLMKARLDKAKKNKLNLEKPENEEIMKINKEIEGNNIIRENEEEEEDVDVLSQFKENQKKDEKTEMDKLNNGNKVNNVLKMSSNTFRKSTLREGILREEIYENNE